MPHPPQPNRSKAITRSMHSRGVAMLMGLVFAVAALVTWYGGDYTVIGGDRGFVLPSANEWIGPRWVDLAAALCANGLICGLLIVLNRLYNPLRNMTMVYVTFFMAFQMAFPDLAVQFSSGLLMAAVAIGSTTILFGCYKRPVESSKSIFLIFLMFSLGMATQYCFILLIPVFLLGMVQMRVFTMRTLIAAVLGLVTPWWILLGFGLITPGDIHLPHVQGIFGNFNTHGRLLLMISLGITALLALAAFTVNLGRTIAYNARTRAFNGFMSLMTLMTLAAMCADYTDILAYVPLLNACTAYQCAHFFGPRRFDGSWYAITGIIIIYIVLYLCRTLL